MSVPIVSPSVHLNNLLFRYFFLKTTNCIINIFFLATKAALTLRQRNVEVEKKRLVRRLNKC